MDIEQLLKVYINALEPNSRYASFDYCFNYFQEHREKRALGELYQGDALQMSCLHLGFYLASWGMLRGSADLLKRSARHLIPLVKVIATAPSGSKTVYSHLHFSVYGKFEERKVKEAESIRKLIDNYES